MRAVRVGADLPPPPDPWAPLRIKDISPLVGRYVAADGRSFAIAAGDPFPRLTAVGDAEPLYRAGGAMATPHPLFARHTLDPVLVGGAVTGLWWGETLFGRDAVPTQSAAPERLRALAGLYINRDPWIGSASVLARGETLVLEGAGTLANRGDWWSMDKDVGGLERFRFDGMLNGQATRLNASGIDLIRL
jgi:hypothetical protein